MHLYGLLVVGNSIMDGTWLALGASRIQVFGGIEQHPPPAPDAVILYASIWFVGTAFGFLVESNTIHLQRLVHYGTWLALGASCIRVFGGIKHHPPLASGIAFCIWVFGGIKHHPPLAYAYIWFWNQTAPTSSSLARALAINNYLRPHKLFSPLQSTTLRSSSRSSSSDDGDDDDNDNDSVAFSLSPFEAVPIPKAPPLPSSPYPPPLFAARCSGNNPLHSNKPA
ncbi:uncharacterized protein BDR25DRAFT_362428 [Lindgomyces ingoldianus]|uniref:Uncharacterized protein n=1 Tax=Lindgomyces ingoldianus TaxID=673940 RepID=A0ACB6Q9Z5_9PLEO|nr:uncharacterized protein BDR25DRAFT_362428 [Lindgomyces ingoldianus]KAF2463859.1 hypothetical protein BDR25DRAFT_362428 [Lindgomyces ingoldianus]